MNIETNNNESDVDEDITTIPESLNNNNLSE